MLKWNAEKIKLLTPIEIWLFIIGRVLLAFGLGILGMKYLSQWVGYLDIPAIVLGLFALLVALKGLKRRPQ
jgi:hypothetical protein